MDIHPKLAPLLAKHELTPDDFFRRGRLPPDKTHVLERRRALVTELHAAGTSWADMIAITGLSQGSIQRLTGAMWNQASRKNVSEKAAASGRARKGEKRPWLTDQMKQQWAEGKFDLHKGREHSDEEIAKQQAAYTPEVRARMSQKKKDFYVQHPEALTAMSQRAADMLARGGHTFGRGIVSVIETKKGGVVRTRSILEQAAADRLDADPNVVRFEVETPLDLPNGRRILPDFLAFHPDQSRTLIEVKPHFVLTKYDETHQDRVRLAVAAQEAARRGWSFAVWTEKELRAEYRKRLARRSATPF